MANTEFSYLYRDASNYKQWGCVVFAGEITDQQRRKILVRLSDGQFFIPEQIGLGNVREKFTSHYEDDHVWNEFDRIELTEEAPTDERTITEFVDQVAGVTWDVEIASNILQEWVAETPQGK